MTTMSVAVQAPSAIRTISIAPGALFDSRSESNGTACPEGPVARNFCSPIHFTDAVCMSPSSELRLETSVYCSRGGRNPFPAELEKWQIARGTAPRVSQRKDFCSAELDVAALRCCALPKPLPSRKRPVTRGLWGRTPLWETAEEYR